MEYHTELGFEHRSLAVGSYLVFTTAQLAFLSRLSGLRGNT